jgi:uncharacterized protein YsxB (DUF464 family)
MVKVEIIKDPRGFVKRFIIKGHSNYDVYGSDIVCSAISVLTQTTLIGLQSIAEINVAYTMEDGYLDCEMPVVVENEKLIKANAILDTMVLGLSNIKKNYSSYIHMEIKEEV